MFNFVNFVIDCFKGYIHKKVVLSFTSKLPLNAIMERVYNYKPYIWKEPFTTESYHEKISRFGIRKLSTLGKMVVEESNFMSL